jgi:hypothetical protein
MHKSDSALLWGAGGGIQLLANASWGTSVDLLVNLQLNPM